LATVVLVTFLLACNQQTENAPKQSKTSVATEKLPMENIDVTGIVSFGCSVTAVVKVVIGFPQVSNFIFGG